MSGAGNNDAQIADLKAQIAARDAVILEQIEGRKADMVRLTGHLATVTAQRDDFKLKAETQQQLLEALRKEIDILRTPTDSTTSNQVDALMTQLGDLEAAFLEEKGSTTRLKEEVDEALKLNQALKRQLHETKADLAEKRATIQALKTKITSQFQAGSDAQKASDASAFRSSWMDEKHFAIPEESEESASQLANSVIIELLKQLETAKRRAEEFKSRAQAAEKATKDLPALQDTNAAQAETIKALKEKLAASQKALSASTSELDKYKTTAQALHVQLGESDREKRALQAQLQKANQALRHKTSAPSSPARAPGSPTSPSSPGSNGAYFKAQLATATREIAALKEQLRSAQAAAATAYSANKALREERDAALAKTTTTKRTPPVSARISALEAQLQKARADLGDAVEQNAARASELERRLADALSKVEELESRPTLESQALLPGFAALWHSCTSTAPGTLPSPPSAATSTPLTLRALGLPETLGPATDPRLS